MCGNRFRLSGTKPGLEFISIPCSKSHVLRRSQKGIGRRKNGLPPYRLLGRENVTGNSCRSFWDSCKFRHLPILFERKHVEAEFLLVRRRADLTIGRSHPLETLECYGFSAQGRCLFCESTSIAPPASSTSALRLSMRSLASPYFIVRRRVPDPRPKTLEWPGRVVPQYGRPRVECECGLAPGGQRDS